MEPQLNFEDASSADKIKELKQQLVNRDKLIDDLRKNLKISNAKTEELSKANLYKSTSDEIDIEKLKSKKILGNAVSGDVFLNEMELEIIDTLDFQRLNNIKQLGTTNLVYRSSVHTRFDHSIGVLQMANIIINKIKNNYLSR